MKGYGLVYFVSEAFRGLRSNSLVNLLAVGTISMAMLIVGVFLVVFLNLRASVNALSEKLEISAYLRDDVTETEREYLLARLRAEPGVRRVSYISKDRALEIFKNELKGQEALLEGLKENPLPDSFEIGIDPAAGMDAQKMRTLSERVSDMPGVEDVIYGKQGAENIIGMLRAVTYGGMAFGALLGITVVFIISNSVRLALYSRGQEIELMQWIGATKGFIQGPFLIEGMLLALMGTALSIGILTGLYYLVPEWAVLFLSGLSGLDFLPLAVVAYMIAGGGLLGLAGGIIAVNRFLE